MRKLRNQGRSEIITFRVTPAGRSHVDAAAKKNGMDRSDYLRGLLAFEAAENRAGRSLFIKGYKP